MEQILSCAPERCVMGGDPFFAHQARNYPYTFSVSTIQLPLASCGMKQCPKISQLTILKLQPLSSTVRGCDRELFVNM